MSYTFEYNDKEVWSPNRDVSLCFLWQVRHLEEQLDVKSGLNEFMSDTIEIDFEKLELFFCQLVGWANLEHVSMRLLLKGVCVHLLALLLCAIELPDILKTSVPQDWIDDASTVASRSMTALVR